MHELPISHDRPAPQRRVREQVRDGVAVAVTSIAASVGLVLFAALLLRLV